MNWWPNYPKVKLGISEAGISFSGEMIDYSRKLQHCLTVDISQKQSEDFIKNIKSNRDAARLRSLQGKVQEHGLMLFPQHTRMHLNLTNFV